MPDIRIVARYSDMTAIIAKCISKHAPDREIRILEAGCGRKWELSELDVPYHLTGLDLDSEALEFRKSTQKDLHEAIVGDLVTAEFPTGAFDVIYASYVLEHVRDASTVLKNFLRWLKPGGLLIIKIPDRDTAFGFVARVTPQWFHVFFYKYALGKSQAGAPGHGPYPAFYDAVLARKPLLEFAEENGFEVREICGYHNEIGRYARRFIALLHFLSLGSLRSTHEDLMFVFQKRPATAIVG